MYFERGGCDEESVGCDERVEDASQSGSCGMTRDGVVVSSK